MSRSNVAHCIHWEIIEAAAIAEWFGVMDERRQCRGFKPHGSASTEIVISGSAARLAPDIRLEHSGLMQQAICRQWCIFPQRCLLMQTALHRAFPVLLPVHQKCCLH